MPELPEVETVRRGLQKLIVGKKIASVSFDWQKSFPNDKKQVDKFLIGSKIISVRRRAKVLIIDLNSGYSLIAHLKMTGQMVFRDGTKKFGAGHPGDSLIKDLPDKSTRVIFEFLGGGKLFFNDQRKFGWVKLLPSSELLSVPFLQKLGPEPIEKKCTPDIFVQRFRRRNSTAIKAALLDQTVVSGVGNIYADECLWAVKVHPSKKVKEISDSLLKKTLLELRKVLLLSIKKGGSTDRNYVDAEGKKGSYLSFAKVFRRNGKPCKRCKTVIIKIRVAGRGTHLCQECQK